MIATERPVHISINNEPCHIVRPNEWQKVIRYICRFLIQTCVHSIHIRWNNIIKYCKLLALLVHISGYSQKGQDIKPHSSGLRGKDLPRRRHG